MATQSPPWAVDLDKNGTYYFEGFFDDDETLLENNKRQPGVYVAQVERAR